MRFLENILTELRHAGLVQSRRGAEGGYWLSRLPREVTIADDHPRRRGPAGERARRAARTSSTTRATASRCASVWIALRRQHPRRPRAVTLADIVADELPPDVGPAPGATPRAPPPRRVCMRRRLLAHLDQVAAQTGPRADQQAEEDPERRSSIGLASGATASSSVRRLAVAARTPWAAAAARRRSGPRRARAAPPRARVICAQSCSPSASSELDPHLEARGGRSARSSPPRPPAPAPAGSRGRAGG